MSPSTSSKDCIHWGLLPPATEAMKQQTKLAKGRFTGDPSYDFEHTEMKKVGEGDDVTEEEVTVSGFNLPTHHKYQDLFSLSPPSDAVCRSIFYRASICHGGSLDLVYTACCMHAV